MSGGNPAGKRHKSDPGLIGGGPHDGYHSGYGRMPPQAGYQHPSYGGPPGGPGPMGPQAGYVPWQHGSGQYGGPPPPPHSWTSGSMYGQRGSGHSGSAMTPERPAYGAPPSYRGPPRPMPGPPGSAPRMSKMGPGGHHGSSTPDPASGVGPDSSSQAGPAIGGNAGATPNAYQWGQSHGGQWPQNQWNNGPQPHGMYSNGPGMSRSGYEGMYSSGSPARASQSRPRSTPTVMGGYTPPMSAPMCQPTEAPPDIDPYGTRSVAPPPHEDDGNASTAGRETSSTKDKGRGSYKCGRCGVPKKGHICPYQPKLTRRPGEPLPEMRCAAVQVEMDEFMTLRRLNIEIQGLPESYATEPSMEEEDVRCIGEPRPPVITSTMSGVATSHTDPMLRQQPDQASTEARPAPSPASGANSPMRGSPVAAEQATAEA